MIKIVPLYPDFKPKCLTFSYDDGVIQDLKFLSLIRKTSFQVTFNLNSGLFRQIKFRDGVDNSRLDNNELRKIYYPYEIASHSLYHFHMEKLNYADNFFQIKEDIDNLKKIFFYKIRGFAYPFGTYSLDTIKALKENNIAYARTTHSTYDFLLPSDFLLWNPTIHHNDIKLKEVVENFQKTTAPLALLYIWGHTYEFENQNNWEIINYLSNELDNKKDIAYLSNIEIFDYINALRNVIIKSQTIINPTNQTIYLKIDDEFVKLEPSGKIDLKGDFIWKKF